jgi:hypothetical protein
MTFSSGRYFSMNRTGSPFFRPAEGALLSFLRYAGLQALKGQRNVAQGKRLSAPPWVEVPSRFAPLPRVEVSRHGKMGSQSGGEGKGSGGRWESPWERTQYPPCPEAHLWVKISLK